MRSEVAARARAAVQEGVRKLAELQNADGGLGYWYKWSASSALTAYALRFLSGAKEFIPVDENVRRRLRAYLLAHQIRPGVWGMYRWDLQKEAEDANTTAYVARTLARTDRGVTDNSTGKEEKEKERQQLRAEVDASLHFLEQRIESWSACISCFPKSDGWRSVEGSSTLISNSALFATLGTASFLYMSAPRL